MRIRSEVRSFVVEYLSKHPCIDCGEKDIVVLEFDHKQDKIEAISRMTRGFYSLDTIVNEIKKCEVRCANCHRRKTALQFGWFKKEMPL